MGPELLDRGTKAGQIVPYELGRTSRHDEMLSSGGQGVGERDEHPLATSGIGRLYLLTDDITLLGSLLADLHDHINHGAEVGSCIGRTRDPNTLPPAPPSLGAALIKVSMGCSASSSAIITTSFPSALTDTHGKPTGSSPAKIPRPASVKPATAPCRWSR